MNQNVLSVREIRKNDIDLITQYWVNSDKAILEKMGVDLNKLPKKEEWEKMLLEQLEQSYQNKQSYCIIWELNGIPVGHSNVNKIKFGDEAFMHLHIWNENIRSMGLGTSFVKKTLPYFFKNLSLKRLNCEPNSLNLSPNNTLKKVGFTFVKEYETIPGWINFK